MDLVQSLFIIAEIGSANGMASRALARLSQCCQRLNKIIQHELNRRKQLRNAWAPIIAPKLHKFLVSKSHPVKYSGRDEKIIPITDQIGINRMGFRFLDPGVHLFDDTTTYALTNMWVIAHHPVDFSMILIISEYAICEIKVTADDYHDTGTEIIPQSIIDAKYGGIAPGQYVANLRLPLRYNPITLCPQIMDPRRLCFCIYPPVCDIIEEVSPGVFENIIQIMNDVDLVMDNFTHVVAQFKTAEATAYAWGDYGLMIKGKINQLVNTTSMIRKKSETVFEGADVPYIPPDMMEMLFAQAGITYIQDAPVVHSVYDDSTSLDCSDDPDNNEDSGDSGDSKDSGEFEVFEESEVSGDPFVNWY